MIANISETKPAGWIKYCYKKMIQLSGRTCLLHSYFSLSLRLRDMMILREWVRTKKCQKWQKVGKIFFSIFYPSNVSRSDTKLQPLPQNHLNLNQTPFRKLDFYYTNPYFYHFPPGFSQNKK